jgi:hypothetical protein
MSPINFQISVAGHAARNSSPEKPAEVATSVIYN